MNNRCVAYCLAKHLNLGKLEECLEQNENVFGYRDVTFVEESEQENIALFSFGVAVFWGISSEREKALLNKFSPYYQEPLHEPFSDEFEYSINNQTSRIHDDHIDLSGNDKLEKIALSFGIAQSIKLEQFESRVSKSIQDTQHIPRNIAQTGRSQLSRKSLAKKRGELYLVESDINLNFDLLDTPEFFWEFPEVEEYYIAMSRYLDVMPRVEVLNKRLSVIRGLLDMLADEQKHKHSATLEWIIIWLIAIEIILFVFYDLLGTK